MYDVDVGVLRGDLVEEDRSVVGGPIIDEYNLVLGGRKGLADHRPDAVIDIRPGIVDRDDHADFQLHLAHPTLGYLVRVSVTVGPGRTGPYAPS